MKAREAKQWLPAAITSNECTGSSSTSLSICKDHIVKVKGAPADSTAYFTKAEEEMEDLALYVALADVLLAIAAMLKRAEFF